MNNLNSKGWARVHRKIESWKYYFSEPFTYGSAWLDLIIFANHKDNIVNIRGNLITIKRGQIGWSEDTLARRWTWSRGKVRRFLRMLEIEQQIVQQKDRFITTIITILNYENYQNDTADSTAERQQKDSRQYINNNDKNDKNRKIYKKKFGEFVELTNEDINSLSGLIPSLELPALIDRMNDYCASVGKGYKNYAAALRNWYRRESKPRPPPQKFKTEDEILQEFIIKTQNENTGTSPQNATRNGNN